MLHFRGLNDVLYISSARYDSLLLLLNTGWIPRPGVTKMSYHPLDQAKNEIRLVRLAPGTRDDALQTELLQVPLSDTPPYEVLSYEWGTRQDSVALQLDGKDFSIGGNLAAALVEMRLDSQARVFWIDAICVNQSDVDERNFQVKIMRHIYTTAQRVLIWLGPEDSDSDIAMRFLQQLEQDPIPVDMVRATMVDDSKDTLLDSLRHIHERSYWKRIWITQEVVCAKSTRLWCGSRSLDLHILDQWANILCGAFDDDEADSMTGDDSAGFVTSLYIGLVDRYHAGRLESLSSFREAKLPTPLHVLLCIQRNSGCSEPRDMVYALIGISSQNSSTHPGLVIDYSRSVSEIFRGTAQAIIEETGTLDILLECTMPDITTPVFTDISVPPSQQCRPLLPGLPSWAPDWYASSTRFSLNSVDSLFTLDRVNRRRRAEVQFSHDGTVLTVRGTILTHIEFVSDSLSILDTETSSIIDCMIGWRRFYSQYSSDVQTFERLVSTGAVIQVPDRWEKLRQRVLEQTPLNVNQKFVLDVVFRNCRGRRLFAHEDFPTSLCPQGAVQGDLVCIFYGCSRPVVLRPHGSFFKVVGDAYTLDCLDQNEQVTDIDLEKYETRLFEIH